MSASASAASRIKKRKWQSKKVSSLTRRKSGPTMSFFNRWSDSNEHSFRRMMPEVILSSQSGGYNFQSEFSQAYATIGTTTGDVNGTNSCVQVPATLLVRLTEVLNYAEFAGLFNQYRIDKVEFKVELACGPSFAPASGTASSSLPTLYSRYDPNDAVMSPSWGDLCNSGNAKSYSFTNGSPHILKCVPKPTLSMYVSGLSAGYSIPVQQKSLWMDTSSPSYAIEHYAFKLWFRGLPGTINDGFAIRITPTVFMSFKRTR